MTAAELMGEGIALMFSGMGFVLLFLFILVFAMRLMSSSVNRFFPEPTKKVLAKPTVALSPDATQVTEHEALRPVIIAAIAHHRRQHHL